MADLDEIMAGRSDSAPVEEQTQHQGAPQIEGQPNPQEAEGEGERNPLQPALDAERGKSRKYKEELADVNRRFGEFQQQFNGFMQAFQAQQRPQQPQQPQEVPTIWDNPDGYFDHRMGQALQGQIDPLQQAITFNSRLTAEAIHKADVVKAAEEAFNRAAQSGQIDPREHARINSSPNPFHEAVLWHQRNTALSEIGSDPNAYRERIKAEVLAELQGQGGQPVAQPQQLGSPQGQPMPSSFAGARNAGPRSAPQWSGPKPLSEIMPR